MVEATDDIEIIEDVEAETYILRFKDVKLGDEGYYKVTAKNKLGEDSAEGRVRVISKYFSLLLFLTIKTRKIFVHVYITYYDIYLQRRQNL